MSEVEGSNGAGRLLAQQLLADGERVVHVPAKLSARERDLDTGQPQNGRPRRTRGGRGRGPHHRAAGGLSYDAELEALREEAESLAEALATRKVVERAKGLLMERDGLSEQDAFARSHSTPVCC